MLLGLLKALEKELKLLDGGGTSVYIDLDSDQRNDLRKSAMGVTPGVLKFINTLALVNQLPPEILGTIPKYQEDQPVKDLVTISSVCSYWRNTFLATPSLWTTLDGKGIEKTRAWIQRSKTLPILLEVKGSPDVQVMELLALHFSRLFMVDLSYLEARDRSLITHNHLANLLRPNTFLRVFCVEASDLEDLDAPVTIDGEFPSLQLLCIVGIQVSFVNLRTPNLRCLQLTGAFDLISLLDLLESSPLLESLRLKLYDLQDTFVDNPRKVVLGKPKSLAFFHHGSIMLQHLSLPPGGNINLIGGMCLHQLDGITCGCAQLLSRAIDNIPMSRQIESLSLHTMDACRFLSLSGPNGTLELVTNEIYDPTACVTLLRLFAQHSVESIRDLKITKLDAFPRDFELISGFLRPLSSLRSITLHQSLASQWLLALGTNHCPQLQDLAFRDPLPEHAEYREFARFVRRRSKAGIPVRRLTVTNRFESSLAAEAMEWLRKYVTYVEWA